MVTIRKGWKLALVEFKRYKKEIAVLSIIGFFTALVVSASPYVFGKFVDILSGEIGQMNIGPLSFGLWGTLVIYAILYLLSSYLETWGFWLDRKLGLNLDFKARHRIYGHVIDLPVSFFANNHVGRTISRLVRATRSLDTILARSLFRIGPKFLTIIISLALMFLLSWQLALVVVVGLILYVFINISAFPEEAKLQEDFQKKANRASAEITEYMYNIPLIKEVNAPSVAKGRLSVLYEKILMGANMALVRFRTLLSLKRSTVEIATYITVFVLGIFLASSSVVTVGVLISFAVYVRRSFSPLNELMWRWEQIQDGLIALNDVAKIVDLPGEVHSPAGSKKKQSVVGDIVFNSVHFAYQDGKKSKKKRQDKKKSGDKVLHNINLVIKAGQTVAFVGRSGAGKSTIVKLLGGYYFPTRGSLTINGTPIEQWNLNTLRSQIAVVPQETTLLNNTIKHNLKFAQPRATQAQIENAAKQAFALDFIRDFPKRWKQQVGERGIKLSGGQKQRIAIARAILRDPHILILDEPTSALDAESEHCINASLESLMEGRTTFIIAHRLSTIRRADVVVVMDKGKIVQTGGYQELLKDKEGLFRKLYDLQIGVY